MRDHRAGGAGLPRLALNKTEAARALGVSVDFFDDHVAHELRCVRRGRRRLYPITEIQRWLGESAEKVSYRAIGAAMVVAHYTPCIPVTVPWLT